jgi:YVTN family beta-propeller protein
MNKHWRLLIGLVLLFLANTFSLCAQSESASEKTVSPTATTSRGSETPPASQTYTQGGVAVKFSIQPLAARGSGSELLEASEAIVKFEITETAAGKPLTNLRPVAWIDFREQPNAPDAKQCREKVQSFLQASFADKADVDLNNYFILTLNHEANISVIDPFSSFGTSRLYTLIPLPGPGTDWVMTANQKRLYVSMPAVNQVAVIDTATWKVIANIDAGANPGRLLLQHDENYLWVANDSAEQADSGVTVIDTIKLSVSARLKTGAGSHDVAFSDDDRYAFVSNKKAGTLSLVDVRKLSPLRDLNVGLQPAALAFSTLSKTLYVINEGGGELIAIDGSRLEIVTRLQLQPGLHALRFAPGGRFGFVVNSLTNAVSIFDVSTNRLVQTVPVGPKPDQIAFTKDFAYVRSNGSEFVTMIKITGLGKEGNEVAVSRFPSGQKAPQESPAASLAAPIVPAPEPGAVLVANPADKMIYFYTEGMAAPMGSFQNYRRDPAAVLVADNSLRETSPGVYATTVRLPRRGSYDVPFLLDSPRLVSCFNLEVAANPALPAENTVAIRIEPLTDQRTVAVGENFQFRFKVIDTRSKQPKPNLQDMGVLVFLAPGIWQERMWAKSLGDGVYEASFNLPKAGIYYVFFQCPSMGVQLNQLPSLNLQAQTDHASVP